MKLNPDCIRDILFTVEDTTSFSNYMRVDLECNYERLTSYSYEEIFNVQQVTELRIPYRTLEICKE